MKKDIKPATYEECPFHLRNIGPHWCALYDNHCVYIEEKENENGEYVTAFAGHRCQKDGIDQIALDLSNLTPPYDITALPPPTPSVCGTKAIGAWCTGCEEQDKCELFKEKKESK